MDKYGNALLIEDVGATNSFMVIGNFYQALVGNKVCTFVHGWDIGGDEVDLNLGSSLKSVNHGGVQSIGGHVIGELVHYTSNGANGDADYVLTHHSADTKDGRWTKAVWDVFTNLNKASNDIQADDDADGYEIKASNLMLPLASLDLDGVTQHDGRYSNDINPTTKLAEHKGTYNEKSFENFYYDKSVKFIYVNYDNVNEEVDSIEFKSGIQNVSNEELREQIMGWASQAAVKDEQVKAVVIKRDSSDANLKNMLYVTKNYGSKEVDKDTNESFFKVQVVMFDEKGVMDDNTHDIYVNKDLKIGDFASYTKVAGTKHEDNFYRVKTFTRHNANPAALKVVADTAGSVSQVKDEQGKVVKHLLKLTAKDVRSYTGKTLTGIDAGSGAVMHKDSYILGGYRGSSTTVPNTIASAQGVIRTDKAGWLNLTDITKYDDIGNAEELLDIAGNEAKTKANVTLDILLNEAPDSDGFRTAYLIVIHDVAPVSDGAIDDSGKDVRCSVTGYGVVSGKGTIYAAGKQLDTITVAAPAWAFVNADGKESGSASSALKSITWTKYNADGLPYAAAADRTITLGSGTSAGQAVYADGKYTVQMGGISMKEGDYVTISKIEWVEAKVEYTLNGKDVTSAMAATTTRAIKVGVNSSLTFNAGVSGTPAGTFTVTGVKDAENYVNLSSTNINSGPATKISTIQALGGETVKVAITSANATQEFTVAVSDSTPNLSAPAAIKTYITGSGAGDAETATLKVEVLSGATPGQTASIKDSGTAVFPVTITAPQDPRVASYIITLELTMADGVTTKTLDPITLDKNTLTKNAVWQGVNSSATVTGVKITAVTQPSATAAESDAGGDSITVNFSGKVTSVDISKVQVFKTDGTPVTPNSATAVGNSVVITVTGPVEAGWTAIIAGDGVVVEAPPTTSFALANANNGIALFTDPAIADDALVYVVTLAAASGDKLAGKVEVMTYEEAKPEEQPGGPGGSDQPGTPADITVTFEGTPSGWDLPETKTVTVKAGQSATIDLTASANGEVTEGTTYTAAGTVGGQSATLTATLKTASTAESKAVVTVSYEVPGGATEAITVTITSVTAGASAGQ